MWHCVMMLNEKWNNSLDYKRLKNLYAAVSWLKSMLKLQIEIINFCLTFTLTGVYIWGEMNYVGDIA